MVEVSNLREVVEAFKRGKRVDFVLRIPEIEEIVAALEEGAVLKAFCLDKRPEDFPGILEVGKELIRLNTIASAAREVNDLAATLKSFLTDPVFHAACVELNEALERKR